MIKVTVISEYGYNEALWGIGLSRNLTDTIDPIEFIHNPPIDLLNQLHGVAVSLSPKGKGHNKFREFMTVFLSVRAPRYWWQQEATYAIGARRQSQSTMYTLTKRPVAQSDFAYPVMDAVLRELNHLIRVYDHAPKGGKREIKARIKNSLPEGYLQTREIVTNYQTIARVVTQRRRHPLQEWRDYCKQIIPQLLYPEFLPSVG